MLNLFVLICYKTNLHFSDGGLSVLRLQGQTSPVTNTKQLQQASRTEQICENCYIGEKEI